MSQWPQNLQILTVMFSSFLLFSQSSHQSGKEVFVSHDKTVQSEEQMTRAVVDTFNQTFDKHGADALAVLLSEDTVFEDTSPAPDGRRIEGKAAVVEFWRGWFARNSDARFDAEEIIVSGNRARYTLGVSKNAQRSAVAPARSRRLHGAGGKNSGKARVRKKDSHSYVQRPITLLTGLPRWSFWNPGGRKLKCSLHDSQRRTNAYGVTRGVFNRRRRLFSWVRMEGEMHG